MWPFCRKQKVEPPKIESLPKTLAEKFVSRELKNSEFWDNYETIKLIDYEELDGDDIKLVGVEYMKDGSTTPPIIWICVSGDWFFKQYPRFPSFVMLKPKSDTNKSMWQQLESLQAQLIIKKKYGNKFEELGYGDRVYNPRNET